MWFLVLLLWSLLILAIILACTGHLLAGIFVLLLWIGINQNVGV